jgi:hypothetical protein
MLHVLDYINIYFQMYMITRTCVFIRRVINHIVVSIEAYHYCQLHTKCCPASHLSRLTSYGDAILGDHQCGFHRKRSATGSIFCLRQILEKRDRQRTCKIALRDLRVSIVAVEKQ